MLLVSPQSNAIIAKRKPPAVGDLHKEPRVENHQLETLASSQICPMSCGNSDMPAVMLQLHLRRDLHDSNIHAQKTKKSAESKPAASSKTVTSMNHSVTFDRRRKYPFLKDSKINDTTTVSLQSSRAVH